MPKMVHFSPCKGLKVIGGGLVVVAHVILVSPQSLLDLNFDLGLLGFLVWVYSELD